MDKKLIFFNNQIQNYFFSYKCQHVKCHINISILVYFPEFKKKIQVDNCYSPSFSRCLGQGFQDAKSYID